MFETVNSISIGMFGFLMTIIFLINYEYEPLLDEKKGNLKQREGESYLSYLRRTWSSEYQDEEEGIEKSMPKLYHRTELILAVLFYSFILVLILSPIYMNWLVFIYSCIIGFLFYRLIFYLGKTGKIKVTEESFFDIPLRGKPSTNTKENGNEKN